jgi:hypothetical protein
MPDRQCGIPEEIVKIRALQIAGRNFTQGKGAERR